MQNADRPRLLLDSVLLGIIGGLGRPAVHVDVAPLAVFFSTSWIAGYRPPGLPEEGGMLREAIGPHGLWLRAGGYHSGAA